MLKSKLKFIVLLVTFVLLFSTFSFATEVTTTDEISEDNVISINPDDLTEEELAELLSSSSEPDTTNWINNDLYEMNNRIVIDRVVDGNVFLIAKEVVIDGEIGGSAFIMADKIEINGYVHHGLYAMANEIEINQYVYDAYIMANTFSLTKDGFVYRDLKVSAETINFYGIVGRDAYTAAANYNFDNGSRDLESTDSVIVGGNLNYSAKNEIDIPEGIVLGEVNYYPINVHEASVGERIAGYITGGLNSLLYILVVILLAMWLAPKFTEKVKDMNTSQALISLGVGVGSVIAMIVVPVILMLTTVFIKTALVSILLYIVLCLTGTSFASIYFGSLFAKLVKWEGKGYFVLSSLICALIIYVVQFIPFIGSAIHLLVALTGVGILLVNIFPTHTENKKVEKKVAVEEKKEEKKKDKKED